MFSTKMIGPAAIAKLGGQDSELFKTVVDCALKTEQYKAELWGDLLAGYADTMSAAGATLIHPDDAQMAEWNAASTSIWEKFVGKTVTQEFLDQVNAVAKG